MDVSNIANLANAMDQAKTNQDISIAVFKKALDSESAAAIALINALPSPIPSVNLPAHLGQNINTTA